MYRLSIIIEDVFKKYLPVAESLGISLNLDFPDSTKRIESPSKVREPLDSHVEGAIRRASVAKTTKNKGEVKIVVKDGGIEILDNGTVLSAGALAVLNKPEHVVAKSRVGFGTSIFIKF